MKELLIMNSGSKSLLNKQSLMSRFYSCSFKKISCLIRSLELVSYYINKINKNIKMLFSYDNVMEILQKVKKML